MMGREGSRRPLPPVLPLAVRAQSFFLSGELQNVHSPWS